MTGANYHIHKYMVLQCLTLFHSKVSIGFLQQDLQSTYHFGKIQNAEGSELSEEKSYLIEKLFHISVSLIHILSSPTASSLKF